MSDSLSSVWGHSVHIVKYTILRFQKATPPTFFMQFQSTFVYHMLIRGNTGYYFSGDLPNLKSIRHFDHESTLSQPHFHYA